MKSSNGDTARWNNIFIEFLHQLDETTKNRKRDGQPGPFWCHFTIGDGRHVRFKVDQFSIKVMEDKMELKKDANRIITPEQFQRDMRNGIVTGPE